MSTHRTTTSAPTARTTRRPGARRPPAWSVPLLAAAAALLTWGAGTAAGIDAVVVGANGQELPVGPVAVVLAALVAGFAGWGVRALLRRLGGDGHEGRSPGERTWTATCAVVLVVSLLGPLGAATTSATLLLVTLHLVVGAVVTWGLRR